MKNLLIPYSKLELIDYEGTGNKTPVLDLNYVKNIAFFDPEKVRIYLENDLKFRRWLNTEGLKHQADTVMIYYTSKCSKYQYVTFIGEPNAPLTSKFSEMCGNGIRALALHIYLNNEEKNKKLNIWTGSVKLINIIKIDKERKSGEIMVDIGKFNTIDFNSIELLNKIKLVSKLKLNGDLTFTLGSNGIAQKTSEPHLVILYTWNEFKKLNKQLGITLNIQNTISILRNIVSTFGKEITFATDIFPSGINFNIGVTSNNNIYLATHERGLSTNKKSCQLEIQRNNFCKCNTLACGTGGAAVANVAKLRGLISTIKQITTIHPGGEIKYHITNNTTLMTGSARKIE